MLKFALNGRFVVRKQTGQERFASELIRELDKIVEKNEFVLVVPEYADNIPIYQNIQIIKYGKVKSHFWEQISFYRYVKKRNLLPINLTTTCPCRFPGIVCIHDAAYFENSKMLTSSLYGKMSTVWHRFLALASAKRAKKILTVSEYSKSKLMHFLHISEDRIFVIRNAWQHINRVDDDNSIFEKLPLKLESHNYFMALSSLSPQKNFVWIKEVACRNPETQFVVCGSSVAYSNLGDKNLTADNLIFTGFVSDGQMKALMRNCKAFVHPAVYEGFGIPPLEAMACGAQVIVSNATCLPEIYGNSVHYIDPYNYDYCLDDLLKTPVEDSSVVLEKYNWAIEAAKLLKLCRSSI